MLYASPHLISHIPHLNTEILTSTHLCATLRLAQIIRESVSRDREDGLATGQPQGVESEAYLNSTSQVSNPEDAREDDHIRGRSSRFMNYPG